MPPPKKNKLKHFKSLLSYLIWGGVQRSKLWVTWATLPLLVLVNKELTSHKPGSWLQLCREQTSHISMRRVLRSPHRGGGCGGCGVGAAVSSPDKATELTFSIASILPLGSSPLSPGRVFMDPLQFLAPPCTHCRDEDRGPGQISTWP